MSRSSKKGPFVEERLLARVEAMNASGEKRYLYGRAFSWTAAEADEFRESTTLVAEFRAAEGDENYGVYALR